MPRASDQNAPDQRTIAQIVYNHKLLLEELRGIIYNRLSHEDKVRVDRDFLRNPRTAFARLFANRQGSSLRSARSYFDRFERITGHDSTTGQRIRRVSPSPTNASPQVQTPQGNGQPPSTNQSPPIINPPVQDTQENERRNDSYSRRRWSYSSTDVAAEHARYNPEIDERRAMIRRQIALGGTREDAITRYDKILRIRQIREMKYNNLYLKVLGRQFRGFVGLLAPIAIAKTGYDILQGEYKAATQRVGFETFKDVFQIKAPKGEKEFEDFAARIISAGGKYEDAMDIWSKETTWASGLRYKIGTDRLKKFGMILGKEPSLDVMNNPERQIPWLMENLKGISQRQKVDLIHAGLHPYLIRAATETLPLSEDQLITAIIGESERKRKMLGPISGFGYTMSGMFPSSEADILAKYQAMSPLEREKVRAYVPKAYSMAGSAPVLDAYSQIKNALERFPEVASDIERRTPANVEVNFSVENNFPEGDYDKNDVKESVQQAIEEGSKKIVDGMYGAFTNLGVTEGY